MTEPFTKAERAGLAERIELNVYRGIDNGEAEATYQAACKITARYEATVAQVEAERDALKVELEEVSSDRDSWRHCAQNS